MRDLGVLGPSRSGLPGEGGMGRLAQIEASHQKAHSSGVSKCVQTLTAGMLTEALRRS